MSAVLASRRAMDYAAGWNIDVLRGLEDYSGLKPVLMPMDDHGRPVIHCQQSDGVDYYFSRIDYFDAQQCVAASRLIYLIMPGYRNRSAYLPVGGHVKIFEIHKGLGYLLRSEPENEDESEVPLTAIYSLRPEVTPAITVYPDSFYAFEAPDWQHEPLVVSELVTREQRAKTWPPAIELEPHQEEVRTAQGRVPVPEDFCSGDFS